MSGTLSLRCSNLGRVERCGQAAIPPRQYRDLGGQDAALGTCADLFLKSLIRPPALDPEDLADTHDVDPVQVKKICGRILWRWERQPQPLRNLFPDAQVGERLEWTNGAFKLVGEMDVSSLVGYELRVLDLKAGFMAAKKSHWPQLFGYGLLGILNTDATSARLSVWNLMDDTVDTRLVDEPELMQWWGNLVAFLASDRARAYAPDPERCRYCPRLHECEAAADMVRSASRMLIDLPFGADPTRDQLAEALTRARMVSRYAAQVSDWILPQLHAAGGVLPLSDGRELFIERREPKKVLYRTALPVLRQYVSEDELGDCLTVGKGKLEEKVKATVGRGSKGAVVKELMEALDRAGALETSVQEYPDIREAKKPLIGAKAS